MALTRTMLYEEFCRAKMNIHIKGIGRVVKKTIGSNENHFFTSLAKFEIKNRRLQVTEKSQNGCLQFFSMVLDLSLLHKHKQNAWFSIRTRILQEA